MRDALLLALLYLALHGPGLGDPPTLINDEAWYVPAAQAWLSPGMLDPNPNHPPLGKMLIAAGIALLGDHPVGWRAPALVFGLGTVVLTWAFARSAFGRGAAAVAGVLVCTDFLAVPESRMATLDPFLSFFLLAGLYAAWRQNYPAAGVLLGFAASVKLNGLSGVPVALALAAASGNTRRALAILPLTAGTFVLAHLPLLARGADPSWILYGDQLEHHYSPAFQHPHLASIPQWLALTKPFWFYWVNDVQGQKITAIVGWGNPVFWWASLPVLALFATGRHPGERAVAWSWLGILLFWLVSFKGGFFYYMLPCVPFMAMAVGREAARNPRLGAVYLAAVAWYAVRFWPMLVGWTRPYAWFDGIEGLVGKVDRVAWQAEPIALSLVATAVLLASRLRRGQTNCR